MIHNTKSSQLISTARLTLMRTPLLALYFLFTILLLTALWPETFTLTQTPSSIWFGTAFVTMSATFMALLPAYFTAAVISGYYHAPKLASVATMVVYLLAGIPSIIVGIIGFIVFCYAFKLGWSMASATLTLLLLLIPTLTTAFIQLLSNMKHPYYAMARGHEMSRLFFLLYWVPKLKKSDLLDCIIMGWARALGDTAAVMLTCGAVLDAPQSLLDPIRVLNYHIYLLAMETPGGLTEAKTLSLLLVIVLAVVMFVPRWLFISLNDSQKSQQLHQSNKLNPSPIGE